MPFVLQESASLTASPAGLGVVGRWGTGTAEDQVQVLSYPCRRPALASQPRPAPPRAGPAQRPAPRPRQVEARRPAAARTVSRALPTAARSTAAGRSPTTRFRSGCLPGDAARRVPGADSAVVNRCRPSGSARISEDSVRPPEATRADARPSGQKLGSLETAGECVTQAVSPPVRLSDPQPKPLPASADGGLGRLRGCEDNLEHRLLELMSRGSKGTSCLTSGRRGIRTRSSALYFFRVGLQAARPPPGL